MTFERPASMNGPMRAQSFPLADGDAGTSQTIRAMRQLVEQGKKDPRIHELAAKILTDAHVPAEYTPAGEALSARAIYEAVLRNVRYTPDVTGKETLHAAWDIVRLRIGDCDDFTVLLCSLLETIGKTTHIVTISSHAEDPEQFSHVFPEVWIRGRGWIPLDAARKGARFARGPEHWYRRREWATGSDEYVDVGGLQGYAGRHTALGYNPAMLPRAYRANTAPQFRQLRGQAPRGEGNYGVPALRRLHLGDDSGLVPTTALDAPHAAPSYPYGMVPRRLGDDGGFNISSIAPLIQAGATGAANIITASRANPSNPFFVPTTGGGVPYGPYGAQSPYGAPYGGPGSSAFGSGAFQMTGTTMVLLGLGAVALIALGRR